MNNAWQTVVGFPRYEVSNQGEIRNAETGRLLAQRINRRGYRMVKLYVACKGYNREVHRVVCEAFHGPCPPGMQAAHEDGDKPNCAARNLSWKTPKANAEDRERHGRSNTGERNGHSKLTADQAAAIRKRALAGEKLRAIAREFEIAPSTVLRIRDGARWGKVI